MKKLLALLLTGTMVLSLGACGGGGSDSGSGDSGSSDSGSSSGTTLRLVNGKIEVDEQLKKLASVYEEETGVKVEIESMGGGVDIQGTLKGYYQGGNMPDIFVNGSIPDFENWEGMLVDMSDQAWVSDTDQAYVDEEYGTIGFPYTVEAIGLSYNKNILDQAGIDPASITGPDSLRQAFETLEAKKDELGLTAVVGYCAEVASLYWSTGNHLFANYLDAGLDRDDTTYIDMLNDGGQIDTDRMTDFAEMVQLFHEYSDPSLLVSGTYDQQILNFASGKYAFVTQGSWIGATMTSTDADAYEAAGNFEVGMIPYTFEEGIDTILTNAPSWWSIYSESENVDAALDFIQWCSESTAQQILVEEAGFISPFKSCEYVASDPFAQTITDYQNAEKTSAWHWLEMTEGLAQNYTGQVFGDFAAENLDVDGFVSTMQQVLQSAYAG